MSLPPPTQRGHRPPPALVDDAMREIFLRVPPDEPASLVRAAAVCKGWRAILLSDASFARDYRVLHGPTPPMLGFLHNRPYGTRSVVSRFVPTAASFRPPACRDRRHWYVLDSRHGRVLFYTPKSEEDLVVCDPITDDCRMIHADPRYSDVMWKPQDGDDSDDEKTSWNAAVLCAKDRCDHLDCHGGPFLVAFVGSDEQRGTFASVYSSETGEWSKVIFLNQPNAIMEAGHSAVLGSKVYFPCKWITRIVEYNMDEHELSVIIKPFDSAYALVGTEDGMLRFAGLWNSKLHLLSTEPGPNGAVENWVRCRLIELEPLLPSRALLKASVVGFAEGVGAIVLSTEAGLFKIELNSGRSSKIHRKMLFEKVMPYMSFYIGGAVRGDVGGCSGGASGAVVSATTAI